MSPPNRRIYRAVRRRAAMAAAVVLSAASALQAVTHLRRGDKPPDVALPDLGGAEFALQKQTGHPVVLLFGELYHEKSLEACRTLQAIFADPRMGDIHPVCALIVAQQAEPTALRDMARRQGLTIPVLHDRIRRVYGAYQVSVLPSIVIIDRNGFVVHAVASLSPSFQDIVTDAILYGAAQLTVQQFERTVHPSSQPVASESQQRAVRLTELAAQLARRGMHDLAAEKGREALAADPKYVPALIGLGRSAVQRHRLAEAEEQFREAIALQPKSAEAELGLAYVQTLRGGKELPNAEQRVRAVIAARPNDPEAHYLLGLICEQSDRAKDAAASYRRSAELLMARGGPDRE